MGVERLSQEQTELSLVADDGEAARDAALNLGSALLHRIRTS